MSTIRDSAVARLHGHFTRACRLLQSPFLLVVRLYWGWQFAQDGWGKLHHLARVTQYFGSLGIAHPGLVAPFVSWVELIGGIFLILGLASHITGLVLAVNMFVAYWTGDREALRSFISDPGKFYAADPFTFLFAALIVLVFGAGLFSLDALIAWRLSAESRDDIARV
ncbi:MAG TPA: DoxX family protein [Silvibacterium sp.]|nr:DoxX family protein [Silvibacterium sp.]